MSITLLSPFLYLIIGVIFAKAKIHAQHIAATLLTKWVIPLVIIYNVATYQDGVFTIMIATMVMMAIMLCASAFFTSDPIKKFCFFYLNIGWLGLPIASSVWGEGAATIYITAYVANSLFGNAISAGLLDHASLVSQRVTKILKSPPVIGLLIGIGLIPFGAQIAEWSAFFYQGLKYAMSFLGMSILGFWIADVKLNGKDLLNAAKILCLKFSLVACLMTGFIYYAQTQHLTLITENLAALYLIGLLPPAANIIGLETYYLKTGKSASMIASGTLVSIVAIAFYIAAFTIFR